MHRLPGTPADDGDGRELSREEDEPSPLLTADVRAALERAHRPVVQPPSPKETPADDEDASSLENFDVFIAIQRRGVDGKFICYRLVLPICFLSSS